MKRNLRLFFTCLLLLGAGSLSAQSYYFIFETGTLPPYEYNETEDATDIMTSGNDQLSGWTNLQFAWDFYGTPVTGFKASDNGYITFDQGATVSDPNNTQIPNAGGPNNAIYAFWDDLDFGGSGKVRTFYYGVAPNRIHCVQWSGMTRVGTNAKITATLRLHESGGFDVVLDHSSGSAAMNTNGTVGVENAAGTMGTQLQSAPNTQFPDILTDNGDDYVYQFYYGNQYQYDLSVQNSNLKPALAAGSYYPAGAIKNFGSSSVTNFTLNYQLDNEPVVSQNVNTLVLVANGGNYTYNFANPLNLPSAGQFYELKIWCSGLNGANLDQNPSNDTLTIDMVTVLGVNAPKKVLIEEFTATWCGACPTGLAYMDTCYTNFPDQVLGVANHASDAFSFTNGLMEFYGVSGIPDGAVDRSGQPFGNDPLMYPTAWPGAVAQRLNEPCPVGIEVYNTYDPATRTVTGQGVMNYVDYAKGDMRFMLFVVEDGLPGTQAGLGAHTFNHILRALPLGDFGVSGTVPSLVTPGETYVENFSFQLDPTWDINNIHLIGAVMRYDIDKRKHEVLNANDASLDNGVSAEAPLETTRSLGFSPNPISTVGALAVEFDRPAEASFTLFNAQGQVVRVIREGRFTAGIHHVWVDASELPAGIYYLQASTSRGVFTEKVVVAH